MQAAPRRPNPEGTGSLRPVAALLVVADGSASPPPRAGPTRRKHPVRGHCYFPDRLLAAVDVVVRNLGGPGRLRSSRSAALHRFHHPSLHGAAEVLLEERKARLPAEGVVHPA